jgi:transcriptional regulator with XRE-family HTH domain
MTQKALAEASGVSVATVRKLQKGEPAERGRPVLIALSLALGWAPGHLEAVSGGTTPPDDPSADLRQAVESMRADLDEVRERLASVEAAQRGED